jgi:two-component system chemotaxis response regulator CheB
MFRAGVSCGLMSEETGFDNTLSAGATIVLIRVPARGVARMDTSAISNDAEPEQAPIRLLLCDGSALVRSTIARLLTGSPVVTLVDTARNLREAVEKTARLRPDVVVIDVESPIFGGPQAAADVARGGSTPDSDGPIVLASCRDTSAGAHTGLRAIAEGASDVLVLSAERLSVEPGVCLDELVRAAVALSRDRELDRGQAFGRLACHSSVDPHRAGLVAIGAGEGGAAVLERLLAMLPPSLPCPIVIASRLSLSFTRALAEGLDGVSAISVVHGECGMPLHPGTAYVVPGGRVGRVRSLGPGPARLDVAPAADRESVVNDLFASCARYVRAGSIGIVLSGAGHDGDLGARAILGAGGALLAQEPLDSVCAGMPLSAIQAGAAAMRVDQMVFALSSLAEPLARAA